MLIKYKNYGKASTQVSHEYRHLQDAIHGLPASERPEARKVINKLIHDVTMGRIKNNNTINTGVVNG